MQKRQLQRLRTTAKRQIIFCEQSIVSRE